MLFYISLYYMSSKQINSSSQTVEKDDVVVKFAGDSGDGIQLAGTIFSDSVALEGNDIATFPDYPAEIRAPRNTVAGVSGFQVHLGKNNISTSGDEYDVLVAMNPASLKANLKTTKKGATIIVDSDSFTPEALEKAGYKYNPFTDESLSSYNVATAPISSLVGTALSGLSVQAATPKLQSEAQPQDCPEVPLPAAPPAPLDKKTIEKTRNMFALGMIYYIFDKPCEVIEHLIAEKFKKKPALIEINKKVFRAGYDYADTAEIVESRISVPKAKLEKGRYRNITGNTATAWGLLAAAERAGLKLFLGSYPITPATDILVEITKYKSLGAKAFQAEDEIAGICSAIGASYAGALACTSTSGPGLSLKSEALGLAVMAELPLVVVDVQRSGPSTGMPTKSEQSDLNQALYGRNGEAPLVVISASSPANCFYYAYEAAKIALEHMTPVILLTDGSLGNGSQLFRIPKVIDLPSIKPPIVPANSDYKPYKRDENFVRGWAIPGTEGLRHRVGGLEKLDGAGSVSTDPANHELMVSLRRKKIEKIADFIPELKVFSAANTANTDTLVVSWGGTEGTVHTAVEKLHQQGVGVAHAHFNYIMPLPRNTESIFSEYKKIIVFELNDGQFVNYLRGKFQNVPIEGYNRTHGQPFTEKEIIEKLWSM